MYITFCKYGLCRTVYVNISLNIMVCLSQYFADRDIFCAGRVAEEDLLRVAAATGGTVQTSVNNVVDEVMLSYPFTYIWQNYYYFFLN